MTRAEEFVEKQGWEYTKVDGHNGPQLLVKICPFCHDDKGTHFYIKDAYNGPYLCHKCEVSGSLDDLMEETGSVQSVSNPFKEHEVTSTPDKATNFYLGCHKQLFNDPRFKRELDWLTKERRISVSALKKMKVGAHEYKGKNWITFPFWIDGKVHCTKERTIEKDFVFYYFTDNKGGPLYNQDIVRTDTSGQYLIVTEGEMDALALMSLGLKRVVSVSNGSNYINSSWLPILKNIKKLYIGYDGDDKGRRGAKNFAQQFGLERCYILPFDRDGYTDANAFLIEKKIDYTDVDSLKSVREDFVKNLIMKAKIIDIEGVDSLSSILGKLLENDEHIKISELGTPWPSINKLIEREGFSGGDLVVVTANPGIGKTTWYLNIARHWARKGIPGLFFELEYTPERLVKRLITLDQGVERVGAENIIRAHKELGELPMYFGRLTADLDRDKVMQTIRAAHNRYTLEYVVFDNIQFLVNSLKYETQEISLTVKQFKELAMELDLPILLVSHVRKLSGEQTRPTAEDMRSSKMLWGNADLVFVLHREMRGDTAYRNRLEKTLYNLQKHNPSLPLVTVDDLKQLVDDKKWAVENVKQVGAKTLENIEDSFKRMEEFTEEETNEDVYEPRTMVILQKNRFGPGGVRNLHYDGPKGTFVEMERNRGDTPRKS